MKATNSLSSSSVFNVYSHCLMCNQILCELLAKRFFVPTLNENMQNKDSEITKETVLLFYLTFR
jgi:hypothetical protein